MPQSLDNILIHIVFSTKNRYPFLTNRQIRSEMHAYLGGACNNLGCQTILIGGAADHVHIFCKLSRNITTAKLVGDIKRESSKWVKLKDKMLTKFTWQNGYGVFSVGKSEVERLKNYISNQEAHHKKKSFQDECRAFLDNYGIEYDERYVWD